MKTTPIFALMGAIFLIFMGFLIGKQSSTATQPPPQNTQNTTTATMTVETINPQPTDIYDELTANGTIHPKSTAEVSSKTGGVIEQVLVDVGDVVQKGQTLAVLDNSTMTDNVIQAHADLETAKANLAKAKADLARVEPLLAIDAISRQQVDSYRTTLAQAQANFTASTARLNTAKKTLTDTHIKAPVSGVISAKTAQIGMNATGSLFSIIKDGELEWQATINPNLADKIQTGLVAHLSFGDDTIEGTVSHLSPTANAGREIIVHVDLPNDTPLKAGMYQTGRFIIGRTHANLIPQSALMSSDGYDYVWTLAPTKQPDIYTTKRQKVQILAYQNGQIATDLPAQMLIVANSVNFLSENETVKIAKINPPTTTGEK